MPKSSDCGDDEIVLPIYCVSPWEGRISLVILRNPFVSTHRSDRDTSKTIRSPSRWGKAIEGRKSDLHMHLITVAYPTLMQLA
jgi:hypothetical protein